jgi:hypothetical protein
MQCIWSPSIAPNISLASPNIDNKRGPTDDGADHSPEVGEAFVCSIPSPPNQPSIKRVRRVNPQRSVRIHFHRHDCQQTKKLVCGTLNVRSLGTSKLEIIKQRAKDENIGVLCLVETWLEDDPIVLRRCLYRRLSSHREGAPIQAWVEL